MIITVSKFHMLLDSLLLLLAIPVLYIYLVGLFYKKGLEDMIYRDRIRILTPFG